MKTVELRLDLLKKIGEGYNKTEIVKYLTKKFSISKSGAYYHFKHIEDWIGQYCNFSDSKYLVFSIKNRFNYIYREASFHCLHAQSDNARIGYLRVMMEANKQLSEYLPKDVKMRKESMVTRRVGRQVTIKLEKFWKTMSILSTRLLIVIFKRLIFHAILKKREKFLIPR